MSLTTDWPSEAVIKEKRNRMIVSINIRPIWINVILMTIRSTDLAINLSTVSCISQGLIGVINARTIARTIDQ